MYRLDLHQLNNLNIINSERRCHLVVLFSSATIAQKNLIAASCNHILLGESESEGVGDGSEDLILSLTVKLAAHSESD